MAHQIGALWHDENVLRGVAQGNRGKQALRVECVNDHFVAQRAVDDFTDGVLLRLGQKTGRHKDDVSLARKRAHAAHELVQLAE